MKKSIKLLLLAATYCFVCPAVHSQEKDIKILDEDEYTNVIPPSPTAYELGKYGQIPIGYFTGTPNVSVPVYNYQAGMLSVPISLSYNSNGIKVDQLASHVGLGWSMGVGGVITRIVRDLPDEIGYNNFPTRRMYPTGIEEYTYFREGTEAEIDSEPDIFMYNFMGMSGKFMFDNNKQILMMPCAEIRIEQFKISGTNDMGFRFYSGDGVIYEFIVTEKTLASSHQRSLDYRIITSWYLSKIIHPLGDEIEFVYSSESYEYINSVSQMHYRSLMGIVPSCSGDETKCQSYNEVKTMENHSDIQGKRISIIQSNNSLNGKVKFNYDITHPEIPGYELVTGIVVLDADSQTIEDISLDYLLTNNKRVFLEKLTYSDITKSYILEYNHPDGLCKRLSLSQDYWGYYNGKSNNYLLPKINDHVFFIDSPYAGDRELDHSFAQKGMLKKITFPTKGTSEFVYEPNSYFGDEQQFPEPVDVQINYLCDNISPANCPGETFTTSIIPFDQEIKLSADVMFEEYGEDCDSSHTLKATIRVYDETSNTYIELFLMTNNGWYPIGTTVYANPGSANEWKAYLDEDHIYTISLLTTRKCHQARCMFSYYDQDYTVVHKDIPTGGSRIKRLIVKDPITEVTDTTTYYYNQYDERFISSGDPGQGKGFYISKRQSRLPCGLPCSFIDCEYYILQSSTMNNLFNTSGNNIYYEYVTASFGGDDFPNGGETHEYRIQHDYPGFPLAGDGFAQSSTSWTNFGWDNGLEKSVEVFRVEEGQKQLVSKQINEYTNDPRLADTIYSYAISKNYDNVCVNEDFYHICTLAETQESCEQVGWKCTLSNGSGHQHHWIFPLFWDPVFKGMTFCNGGLEPPISHNVPRIDCPPCHGHPEGDTLWYTDELENLNVIEYMNLSSWNYLSKKTVEEYDSDNSGKVTKTTEYIYDNPLHLQLSRVKTFDSKGIEQINQVYYPQDYDTSIFSQLIHQNMVAKPIDQRTLYNGKLQGGKLVHYNEKGQPIAIDQAEDEINTTVGFNQNQPYSYGNQRMTLTYDNMGNKLLSYKGENNMETVILWGYIFSKPIVKIENATESQVMGVLSAMNLSYAELQLLDGGALIDFISVMRNHDDLKSSMVTSYTYDPMIGLTSVTDPTGRVTWYDYDDLGRLETVRDMDGKILKHMEYHFQE
jgi:YD repeat-containing protein